MIKGGYCGKILRVDLTKKTVQDEDLPSEEILRKYTGSTGLGLKYLMDEVPPEVKPLDPENHLNLMTGPLTGTVWPCSSRHSITTVHGDLPKMCGMSWGGGFWAARLKWSGYDGIIIQGKSDNPVYLAIHSGKAELRDASHVWGKYTHDAEEILRDQSGDPRASVLTIGPAGERVLPGACIKTDINHTTAKAGGGRILGSKKLKAIVISGRGQGVPVAEPQKLLELALEYRPRLVATKQLRQGGWPGRYDLFARQWRVGVKNFSDEAFQLPWAEEVVRTVKASKLIPRPCFNCPIGCAQDIIIGKGAYKGFRSRLAGGAEHMEGVGGLIGAFDGGAVLYLTDLCDKLGLESGGIGTSMAILYEAYEKGLIDKKFTDGLELKWGNVDAAITMLHKYVNQEGIGKLLAEGPKGVAKAIGKGAEQFVGGYKGIGYAHDNRYGWEFTLAFATSGGYCIDSIGADLYVEPDVGFTEPNPRFDKDTAPIGVQKTRLKTMWEDCLGICWFSTITVPDSLNYYTPQAVNFATGWDIDRDEALAVGERVVTATRVFNLKRGSTIQDDLDIGPRFLEGFKVGKLAGHPVGPYLEGMVKGYYGLMGWERETGIPTEETLKRLGLDELVKDVKSLRGNKESSSPKSRKAKPRA